MQRRIKCLVSKLKGFSFGANSSCHCLYLQHCRNIERERAGRWRVRGPGHWSLDTLQCDGGSDSQGLAAIPPGIMDPSWEASVTVSSSCMCEKQICQADRTHKSWGHTKAGVQRSAGATHFDRTSKKCSKVMQKTQLRCISWFSKENKVRLQHAVQWFIRLPVFTWRIPFFTNFTTENCSEVS